MKLLTVKDAAIKLGVTETRVRQLVLEKRLPAEKIGIQIVIKEEDLELVSNRPTGRPKKDAISPTAKPTIAATHKKATGATKMPAKKATKITAAQKQAIRKAQQDRWKGK